MKHRDTAVISLLFLIVLTDSLLAWGLRTADVAAKQSHRAICSLYRSDLATVSDTRVYLRTHPRGIPSLGITRAQLLRSIAARQADALSLGKANC